MSKRKESSLLIETLLEEAVNRKRRREENSRDSHARTINRLATRENDLEQIVQNLEWKKRQLEDATLKLQVEQAIDNKKTTKTASATAIPSISTTVKPCHCLLLPSPSSPPPPITSPLPLPSSYEPFLSETSCRPSSRPSTLKTKTSVTSPSQSQPQPYRAQYIYPVPGYALGTPHSTSEYVVEPYIPYPVTPLPCQPSQYYVPRPVQADNPIKRFEDRSSAYWRRFGIAIGQRVPKLLGKRRLQNPEDNLWFEVKLYKSDTIRVRIGGEYRDLKEGME